MVFLSFEVFWAQDGVFHGWLKGAQEIKENSGSDCVQMVQLVVMTTSCTREITQEKVRLKGKKWCLESENETYSEIVIQK